MTDEKNAPAPVISQAIPAIVDATKAVVVPSPTPAPVLSQAPAATATDVKPAVDKASSVIAPTLTDKK